MGGRRGGGEEENRGRTKNEVGRKGEERGNHVNN